MINNQQFEDRVAIGVIRISNVTWPKAIGRVEELIRFGSEEYVLTPNVDHIVQAASDPYLRKIYDECPLVLADGMPIIWASHLLGTPLKEKISGSDFLIRFCRVSAKAGYRIFFLGGGDNAAEISADILRRRYPGLKIVGIHSPPFGFENDEVSNARVLEKINSAHPDLIFVGLGTPKQEKWIYENRHRYHARVSFPVGAGFDFLSGKSHRAPLWMRRSGFEWFWRLLLDPKRLFHRYLIRDMRFFPLVIRQKINMLR
jgi:N-acetylglucosaminyldiphosphoundecaprenol N-acetyl-beta-D-mannosaminyltransferase